MEEAEKRSGDDDLAQLEVALLEALVKHDVAFLERSTGAEFTMTTDRPGAEVCSREEWLRIARDEYAVESFAVDEVVVQRYGEVAVVRLRCRQTGRMGGAARTGAFRMTDVFVRRDGDWQLVTRHATELPEET